MSGIKKSALAILVLSHSLAFAGSMGPMCSAINSTVPCESRGWSVAGKALYLKASTDTAANFVISEPSEYNPTLKYHWGFELEAAYRFNTGNDLNLNWYHVKGSSQESFGASPSHIISLANGLVTQSGVSGTSTANGQWDAVNIEVGQRVNYDDDKSIRFHGGAQFAHIKSDIDLVNQVTLKNSGVGTPNVVTSTNTYQRVVDADKTFNGFGPRVGADLSYTWKNGLGVYANAATTILVGTGSHSNSFQGLVGSGPLGVQDSSSHSVTAVSPEFDAKLGVKYTYMMAQGDLTVDAGWMWTDYLSVFASSDSVGERYDFGLQGLYFGLKWLGDFV